MGDKTVSVRVRFEGGDQVKAGLTEVGREGARAMQTLGGVSAKTGQQLQNTGYQVSDFFVQVAGGTAPTRALAQQLPQLLQGFGLIGVAASVLVAALPSLWALFSSGEEDVASLEKQLEGVATAVDRATKAADLAAEPRDKLIEKYGNLAKSVRDARMAQAELRQAEAVSAVSGAVASVGFLSTGDGQTVRAMAALREDFREPSRQMQEIASSADEVFGSVAKISREFKLSKDEALNLAVAIDRVGASANSSATEQVAAAESLRATLIDTFGSMQAANLATTGLVDKLNIMIEQSAELSRVTGTVQGALLAASSVDLSGVFSGAFDAADTLLGKIGDIVAAANESVAAFSRAQSARNYITSNSPGGAEYLANQYAQYGAGRAASNIAVRESGGLYGARDVTTEARRSGGGGGGGGVDKDLARAAALTEGVRTETEKYALALEEVSRLKAKGLVTDETYNRQLDKLNEKLGETGDLGKQAASAIKGAFDGLFDDPAAALKNLSQQLAQMAIYRFLGNSFPSVFGAGGAVPLFAAGGYHTGGLRIVGENGPELEATGPSTIYPNSVFNRLSRGGGNGGGGGGTNVQIINMTGQPARTETTRGPTGEEMVRVLVGEEIARGGLDKSMRGRFGAAPQRTKR